jgi:carbamoyltransferase
VLVCDGRGEARSQLAHPGHKGNLDRLNAIKGREQFRPVAPMVLDGRASGIFSGGPLPSPYMLFTHQVSAAWRNRIPTVTHVDGTARTQTVTRRPNRSWPPYSRTSSSSSACDRAQCEPEHGRAADGGRPEGRAGMLRFRPVDTLALGPFLIRRGCRAGRYENPAVACARLLDAVVPAARAATPAGDHRG